jgi:hypothetical protein
MKGTEMAVDQDITSERPTHKYQSDDVAWHRYVFMLSSKFGMQRKDVAAMCGIKLVTMDTHATTMSVWAEGQAFFKNKIWANMLDIACDEPNNYADPIEKSQVRSLKADMNKHISKIFEKREELAGVKEDGVATREALGKLSDDELRAKAEKLLGR